MYIPILVSVENKIGAFNSLFEGEIIAESPYEDVLIITPLKDWDDKMLYAAYKLRDHMIPYFEELVVGQPTNKWSR